jgi:alpha-tubulin suppressor-like RCC1 family protein
MPPRARLLVVAAPLVVVVGVAVACSGARTGFDLFDHDAADAGRDTRVDDTAVRDTRPAPDTRLPDTILPDTLLPDTLRPDTLDAGPPIEVLAAKSVSLGDDHTCVVLPDRTVKCWGRNENGQVGDGTTVDRLRPTVVPGISGVLEIAAGGRHNCIRNTGGTVRCWGWNERGQLGDGTNIDRPSAGLVPGLVAVVQIAGGHWHTCVLVSDGTARCWGENASGQLGDDSTLQKVSPVPVVSLTGVQRISAGCEHTCAVMSDRTLQCWGNNTFGQLGLGATRFTRPALVPDAKDVADVSLGCYSTCYRTVAGVVTCMGRGMPKPAIEKTTVAQVAVSGSELLIVRRIGDTVTDQISPSSLDSIPSVLEVAAGATHACARQDKTLWCAGYNHYGELGDGTTTDRVGPGAAVKVPLD